MTKFKYIIFGICVVCGSMSCSKMLETESDMVEFEEDHTLNHATDSVSSVMGIINSIQKIADRVVLLGEVRGDLIKTTAAASADLKRLSAFNFDEANTYNQVSDYYAVINNCNYFLAHVDTAMERRGRNLFMREYAAVKSYRAWTYLQLALAYGEVPLILQPLMTEKDARKAMDPKVNPYKDIKTICETFINDLTPYVGVNLPDYQSINKMNSKNFFIPMRALLGDLCLWAGQYKEAARWYNAYLNDKYEPIGLSRNRVTWSSSTQFNYTSGSHGTTSDDEVLCFIPMESNSFQGNVSNLRHLFNSTTENHNYFELTYTPAMTKLSTDQLYCFENSSEGKTTKDTIYAQRDGLKYSSMVGDLRLYNDVTESTSGTQDEYSEYSSNTQTIRKIEQSRITMYRRTMVYLRYAEALNRAGYPQTAFAILKHGICEDVLKERVDTVERKLVADLAYFDPNEDKFKLYDEQGNLRMRGIHAIGSGDVHADTLYALPQPKTALPTREDTVNYQIPLVEDMIITEMALEGAFEGYRFNDLMRVALRRNDPAYLAKPISRRNSKSDDESDYDADLRQKLMNPKNWYLPLQ